VRSRWPPDPHEVEVDRARTLFSKPAGTLRSEPDRVSRSASVVLWRAGLRISEALALSETDLDCDRGELLVRRGKGDKRREVGMDRWAWSHLEPWLELRSTLPAGRVFCVVRGSTRGRPCAPAGIREQLHHAALAAGVRRRFAPHQLRHAHAVEMSREGISLIVIQRQLGHADLAITSRYLRGIDNTEIIQAVYQRPEPMIPAGRQLPPER
jgi:site-specific recombinase XerD